MQAFDNLAEKEFAKNPNIFRSKNRKMKKTYFLSKKIILSNCSSGQYSAVLKNLTEKLHSNSGKVRVYKLSEQLFFFPKFSSVHL